MNEKNTVLAKPEPLTEDEIKEALSNWKNPKPEQMKCQHVFVGNPDERYACYECRIDQEHWITYKAADTIQNLKARAEKAEANYYEVTSEVVELRKINQALLDDGKESDESWNMLMEERDQALDRAEKAEADAAVLLRLVQNAYGIMFTRGYTKLWVEQADKALSLPNPGADLLAERDRLRGLMQEILVYPDFEKEHYSWCKDAREALKEKP